MNEEIAETTPAEETAFPPPTAERPLWRDIVLGLVILICGAVIGSCATILIGGPSRFDPRMRPEPDLETVVPRMLGSLNLTRQQREAIRPIVRERVGRVLEIRDESRTEAVAELKAMEEEVTARLTPEQVQRWRQVLDSYRRLGAGRGRGWGPENRGGAMGRGQPPNPPPGQGQGRGKGTPGRGQREAPRPVLPR